MTPERNNILSRMRESNQAEVAKAAAVCRFQLGRHRRGVAPWSHLAPGFSFRRFPACWCSGCSIRWRFTCATAWVIGPPRSATVVSRLPWSPTATWPGTIAAPSCWSACSCGQPGCWSACWSLVGDGSYFALLGMRCFTPSAGVSCFWPRRHFSIGGGISTVQSDPPPWQGMNPCTGLWVATSLRTASSQLTLIGLPSTPQVIERWWNLLSWRLLPPGTVAIGTRPQVVGERFWDGVRGKSFLACGG